jgi:hypothetical protein
MAGRGNSLGRILGLYVEREFQRPSLSPTTRLTRWLVNRRTASENKEHAARLASAFAKSDPFSKAAFLQHAMSSYEDLLDSISSGNEQRLRGLVVERLLPLIRKGIRDGIIEHGARQGTKVIQWLEPAAIVQTRAGSASPELSRSFFEKPSFGQLTVRFSTLQQPFARGATRPATRELDMLPALPADQHMLRDWYPVADLGTGHTYWVDDATGSRRWEPPPQSQLLSRCAFRVESAGSSRVPETSASGDLLVRVTQNVIFEKSVDGTAGTGVSAWRIVRL